MNRIINSIGSDLTHDPIATRRRLLLYLGKQAVDLAVVRWRTTPQQRRAAAKQEWKADVVNPLSSLFSDVVHAVNVGKVCVLCPKRCFMRVGGCQNKAISHSQFVSEG